MQRIGVSPPLPDVGPGAYLIQAFRNLRFARSGEFGLAPQTWAEIEAFARSTGAVRHGWECQALFDMSWAYVEENSAAANPFRMAPMEREAAKDG
jgi:hypothetical protein